MPEARHLMLLSDARQTSPLSAEWATAMSLSLSAESRPAPSAARLGRTWPPSRVDLQSWIELAPVAPAAQAPLAGYLGLDSKRLRRLAGRRR